MKLVQATVSKHPREVTTKYGQRSVLDCLTRDGEQLTVWRRGGDLEVLGRYPGERVMLAVDSKGKVSLIEHGGSGLNKGNGASALPDTTPIVPLFHTELNPSSTNNSRNVFNDVPNALPSQTPAERTALGSPKASANSTYNQSSGKGSGAPEIRDYTDRLAKLYSHCYRTVKAEMDDGDLPAEALKDIATTIFIQTSRKFNL